MSAHRLDKVSERNRPIRKSASVAKESSITCFSKALEPEVSSPHKATDEAYCTETSAVRCINVPVNVCRMKPIDSITGKNVKRKFTVKKENVKAEWWKE